MLKHQVSQTINVLKCVSPCVHLVCPRFEAEKMERYSKYQGVNLYVKNLEDEVDDERLRKEFTKFGNITSAKVGGGLCVQGVEVWADVGVMY